MNDHGVAGAIIGGGEASRFGGLPKGLERVGGIRIIDRVAIALRPHTDSLLIAAGNADASSWIPGAIIAPDQLSLRASVTGIHAALAVARQDTIVIAWDMPFVPSALVARLRSELRPGVSAVVPRVNSRPEPLCAAYSPDALAGISEAVERGVIRMTDILDTIGTVVWLDDEVLRRIGDPEVMFFNVNSPADLRRAEEMVGTL